MDEVAEELSLGLDDLWLGVVSGAGIYLAVVLLTRFFGQRSLASVSTFDFPVTVAIGAIVGRTALVQTSLLGGVVALTTLFGIQACVGWLRHHTFLRRAIDNPPVLLVSRGTVLRENLRRAHLDEDALNEKLRAKGIGRLADVHALILERNGDVSVLTSEPDPTILADVRGGEDGIERGRRVADRSG